ncbi:SPOR domain-containing protein [Nitratireductor luteus]|uniref:SPOR domain-containing protein n=1 Tax=Nitratireductor luteus TaxID=2976980 RepID=UPI00223F1FB8|nr:SPOR domain-containing protein [Nitratireductor luteus]
MADRNFANSDEPVLMAEDDPFAELTRIMGHDPRQTQPQDEVVDDLALELENELLGEMDPLADIASDEAVQASVQRSPFATDADTPDMGAAAAQAFAEEGVDNSPDSSSAGQDDPFIDLFEAEFESAIADDAPHPTQEDVPHPTREIVGEPVMDDSVPVEAYGADEAEFAASAPEMIPSETPSFEAQPSEIAPFEMRESDMNVGSHAGGAQDDDAVFDIRDEDLAALDSDFALPETPETTPSSDADADDGGADSVFEFDYARAASERPDFLYGISDDEPAQDASTQDSSEAGESLNENVALPEQDVSWQQPDDEPDGADDWSPDKVFVSSSAAQQDWSPFEGHEEPAAGEPAFDAYDGAPEIDTVDVPGEAVAVADALDVPEVPYREPVKSSAEFDEIDEMLSGAFGAIDELAEPEVTAAAPVAAAPEQWNSRDSGTAAAAYHVDEPAGDDAHIDFNFDDLAYDETHSSEHGYSTAAADQPEPAYWTDERAAPSLAPTPGAEPPPASGQGRFGSRAILVAALLGGVVLAGGVGVYAFGGGGAGSVEPVLIKADNSPIKVKPENPGGTTIPNQDNEVYKRVSGESSDIEPAQTALVTTTEEPINIASKAAEGRETTDASAKVDDRLVNDETGADPASGAFETVSLTPRRVRSLVVRPDGTMAPREMPEPSETAGVSGTAADELTSAAETIRSAAQDSAALGTAARQTAEAAASAIGGAAGETQVAAAAVPRTAPIPPAKPANRAPAQQPAAQQQQAAPAQQAPQPTQAAAPAGPAATTSAPWSVQISSQPSAEAAQQSYQDMAQRYGSILQGKGVNIVKADIAGKGTYFRVRIPSSSKDEAIQLCSQLKSAGGSCFVSK